MKQFKVLILAVACLLEICHGGYTGASSKGFCEKLGPKPKCSRKSPYRTLDGLCNNLENPFWGNANYKYARILPNRYGDNLSTVPKDLPSARQISNVVFADQDNPDTEYTIVQMQFGQFIAHDMGMTPNAMKTNGCCENGKFVDDADKSCFRIEVPKNDPTQIDFPRECMDFSRTPTDHDQGCVNFKKSKPAQQINAVTSFLDLSLIYGNSEDELKPIRSYKNGKLIVEERKGNSWPPQNPDAKKVCNVASNTERCYLGGDPRLNSSPDLLILHVLFIREHNRIAEKLNKLNPLWNDTRLFEEARKINIAQYQYISYYEWLPNLIGEQRMNESGLLYDPKGEKQINDYDSNIDATTINEYSTVAFRFFHTQIMGQLKLLTETRRTKKAVFLRDWFNRPKIVEDDNNFDLFSRGMTTQQCQGIDVNYDKDIRDFLFKHLKKYGDDLKAFDIQRDRDHGCGSYNDAREYCGLGRFKKWEDLLEVMEPENVDSLKKIYKNVDQIELSVGGALENNMDDADSGPTYNCIYIKQYYNTRVGDRFWFETTNKYTGFYPNQLYQIRKASMARIFCDNANDIKTMQPRAFDLITKENKKVPCSELPVVRLEHWVESQSD